MTGIIRSWRDKPLKRIFEFNFYCAIKNLATKSHFRCIMVICIIKLDNYVHSVPITPLACQIVLLIATRWRGQTIFVAVDYWKSNVKKRKSVLTLLIKIERE